jgi:hypothetical protein
MVHTPRWTESGDAGSVLPWRLTRPHAPRRYPTRRLVGNGTRDAGRPASPRTRKTDGSPTSPAPLTAARGTRHCTAPAARASAPCLFRPAPVACKYLRGADLENARLASLPRPALLVRDPLVHARNRRADKGEATARMLQLGIRAKASIPGFQEWPREVSKESLSKSPVQIIHHATCSNLWRRKYIRVFP